MLALIIILGILVLILLLPVGADVSFISGVLTLKVKVGPVKLQLMPAKKPKKEKPPKEKTEKVKPPKDKTKKKQPLTKEDIFEIVKLGLKALNRFRKDLSIDVLMFHLCVGGDDPFDTVKQYGNLNAGLGVLYPHLHRCVKIKKEDIATAVDFEAEKTTVEARVQATLQIWEIFHIALCAGFGFLAWIRRRKKRAKALEREKATAQNHSKTETNPCS